MRTEVDHRAPSRLPIPSDVAYFPQAKSKSEHLQQEVLKRTGDNLVYAIQYGSSIAGDATSTSMIDMIIIVENTKEFHERNKSVAAKDYGIPRSTAFHDWLNRFGFNFYHSAFQTENGPTKTKYAVISRDNFVKGCHGSLLENEKEKIGAFGFYVAGRMQKAALKPLLMTKNEQKVTEIEQAINSARIDGVWLTLGLVPKEFTLNDLLKKYVSLSYLADIRIEKPGKIQTMLNKNYQDYLNMILPILSDFVRIGLIKPAENGNWTKIESPSEAEVKKRLISIKARTAVTNYLKNPITTGINKSADYALQKVRRAIDPHLR